MLTSPHAWQLLIDERRTNAGVILSWSVNPQTRQPKVVERPALQPVWSLPPYALAALCEHLKSAGPR